MCRFNACARCKLLYGSSRRSETIVLTTYYNVVCDEQVKLEEQPRSDPLQTNMKVIRATNLNGSKAIETGCTTQRSTRL
jgi:hypothetical protein